MTKRKPRMGVCGQCRFATWDPVAWTMAVGLGWPGRLACVNGAEAPGQLRQVSPGGTCRNFRPRRKVPVRTKPAVDPKTVINPWTMHQVPRGSNVRRVRLTNGMFATVEARDFKKVSKYKWNAKPVGNRYYAFTQPFGKGAMYMHRLIMRPPRNMVVDHIDGNGLNNCRCNLRICTHQQNAANKRGPVSQTGFIGVRHWGHRWQAVFTHKNRPYHIGTYDTAIEAAKARDRFAYEKSHGHARLNFPEDFPAWRPARRPAKKATSGKKQATRKAAKARKSEIRNKSQ